LRKQVTKKEQQLANIAASVKRLEQEGTAACQTLEESERTFEQALTGGQNKGSNAQTWADQMMGMNLISQLIYNILYCLPNILNTLI
jgi:hypothetical protein